MRARKQTYIREHVGLENNAFCLKIPVADANVSEEPSSDAALRPSLAFASSRLCTMHQQSNGVLAHLPSCPVGPWSQTLCDSLTPILYLAAAIRKEAQPPELQTMCCCLHGHSLCDSPHLRYTLGLFQAGACWSSTCRTMSCHA